MAPPRAYAWPPSIYEDVAVLSMDPNGRFIICRACLEHHDKCGGKTPKPVIMNARFRTRAWDTHKRRTRAHRLWPAYNKDLPAPHHEQLQPLRVDAYRSASMATAASNAWASHEDQRISRPVASQREEGLARSSFNATLPVPEEPLPRPRRHSDSVTATSSSDRQRLQQISLSEYDARQSPATHLDQQPEPDQENQPAQIPTTPTSRGHQLGNILNPTACDQQEEAARATERLERSDDVLSVWAQEKMRRNQARPCCDGRSETHQLYWETMRQLFSDPNKTSSTPAIVGGDP